MTYLLATRYTDGSELNLSDQITISGPLWEALGSSGSGSDNPLFVEVGEESGVVGRIVPGDPSMVAPDACQLPRWMIERLGLTLDAECWISLTVTPLNTAGTVTLRAREEATLTDLGPDPLGTLSAALSGSYGPSWACLSVGSELPLAIGIFDVMGIRSAEEDVTMASILNTDVNLDIMPALDHVDRPVTPPKAEEPLLQPIASSVGGFVPFSGRGYRLGDP
jgi:hypothetical protein